VTTKNATVDEINHFALSIVPGEEEIYLSTDSVCTTSSESDNVDLLYP
jgi:ATP-dependent DNA helicase PIF1